MSYRIEKTNNEELVLALQKWCLPEDTPEKFEGSEWWVAYSDKTDEAVGFGGYTQSAHWHNTIYLCRAGVLPDHRGQGLQKRLIRVRLKHARKVGNTWAYTDVSDNPASANSLISCGFKLYSPYLAWGTKETLYWRRSL